MEIVTGTDQPGEEDDVRVCPFFTQPCNPLCPGYVAPVDGCIFEICLTQVREVFMSAARYMDTHLDLEDGTGLQTMSALREIMSGKATQADRAAVKDILGGAIAGAVFKKVSSMSFDGIRKLVAGLESKIILEFNKLWEDEEAEEEVDGNLHFGDDEEEDEES